MLFAATIMPFTPIDVPPAATACQLCAGVPGTLRHWLHDPDLKGIRDEAGVAGLPPEEGKACAELWREVRELLARAGGDKE